ncbi:MAG: 2-hydroxyglutaryl-CoA dehydratase [Chloroflexi bacterium]|nr:2-hydroxyglutaryl-CoA dehydratase [Chloroflexota bacterium]
MALFMWIDIGSGTSNGVITEDGKLLAYHLLTSGVNYKQTAQKIRDELLEKAKLRPEDISFTVATGQGANNVVFSNQQVADIRCCARGINQIFPLVKMVIDVQGQSSQVIRVDEHGHITNFAVSEKCASGSGHFLEVIANILQMPLEDIGAFSLRSSNPVVFSTSCAVFGESEAVSRVAEGASKEDILAGVNKALAEKLAALAHRVGLEEPCAMSGGAALNIGLVKKVEEKLGIHLLVPPQPQFVTALGAAILAKEESTKPVTLVQAKPDHSSVSLEEPDIL